VIDGFLIVYFLGRKGFCRFLCPWGAFLKLPNSLAMYKVRNIGGCQNSGNCISECPVGIDVNFEINHYGKVTSTNCTSCLVCTEGCPSSAISYKWESPLKENFQLKHYGFNRDMFKLEKIEDKFQSLHSRDVLLLPVVLLFGFAIDGLYGMGHFLSFGIAVIASVQVITLKEKIQKSKVWNLLIGMIFLVIAWHGVIKFSIWQGLEQFEKNEYSSAISHLERAVTMYPKPIGRFHLILGQMYMENEEIEKARAHANRAQNINPHHEAPVELLKKINVIEID
jgi:polyferredoxin